MTTLDCIEKIGENNEIGHKKSKNKEKKIEKSIKTFYILNDPVHFIMLPV